MTEAHDIGVDLRFDLADRMRKSLRIADLGVAEIAEYLGVSRNTVSTWINGRITPSIQTQRLWAIRTGVPFGWLQTGEDPSLGGPDGGDEVRHQGLEPRTRWFEHSSRNVMVVDSVEWTVIDESFEPTAA